MPIGTATARLKKNLLFTLIIQLGFNYCYQCGFEIDDEDTLSIEHKIPWLDSDNPIELFFDLNNIAFSHNTCNGKAARQTKSRSHPSVAAYNRGCRCDSCINLKSEANVRYRNKLKTKT